MREALAQAEEALREGQLPVGAVAVIDGQIVAKGRRFIKSNQLLDHAETAALRQVHENQATYRNRNVCIYTTLEPCAMCFGTIMHSRVSKVVFALADPYGGATDIVDGYKQIRYQVSKPEIIGGVLESEAAELFDRFFRSSEEPFWRDPDNPMVKLVRSLK